MTKRITITSEDTYEVKDGCITWVAGVVSCKDDNGHDGFPNWLPDISTLDLHKLGKQIQGVNGSGQVAIVNKLESTSKDTD